MRLLRLGSTGPSVELLQLALNRALGTQLQTDGIFGSTTKAALMRFQKYSGLSADGIAGSETHKALLPYYTGYRVHTVRQGDTLWKLAKAENISLDAVLLANPGIQPDNLKIGSQIIVPLDFPVVPTNINYCSTLVAYCVRGLAARYPFIRVGEAGSSVMHRPLWTMTLGSGENRVLYNAAHHANEWICVPMMLKFIETLSSAYAFGGEILSHSASELLDYCTLCVIPALNPDGIDLVTGELNSGVYFDRAVEISLAYPQFTFPDAWKANINGIDLNLQYPANWEQARENKAKLGIISPAPAEYVGLMPLCAPESRAIYDFTLEFDPALVLAYHTQGEVIYWKYEDYAAENADRIAAEFARVSGYTPEDTPFTSGFAGYKDWYIETFRRPGFTIEAGKGQNPLPLSDFDDIYAKNLGILTLGMIVT